VEQPGQWLNLSEFVSPLPLIPPAGTVVTVAVDGSGYVRAIEPLAEGEAPQPSSHSSPSGDRPCRVASDWRC
jgi:hypothetical protein